MNREIKFRGKRADNGEWVYGFYMAIAGTSKILSANPDSSSGATYYEVIPSTVGQYTGLKDKSGKEIYEDDIVRYYDDIEDCLETGSVSYHDDWCSFNIDTHAFGDPMTLAKYWSCEVIGNIHDNLELMKDSKP